MKVAVLFGYLLGIGLPVMETIRRGFAHWFVNTTTMADDYIMGAVLLVASICFSLKVKHSGLMMVVAWAYVLGVMNAAFWGHLEGHLRGVVICDNNPIEVGAIVGKGIIWVIALACLAISSLSLARVERRS